MRDSEVLLENGRFLFEIGTEEIPAGYIQNALINLQDSFTADLQEYGLAYEAIDLYSTPRRMAIKILGLSESQSDQTIQKTGPAKKVAYDESGHLTKAGQGFLAGAGATESDIITITTPKGEYIGVNVFIKGKESKELLPALMKNAIERIVYPKTMKWGSQRFMFARPIRWLLALYNDAVVDFEFCGLKATNQSMGNRYERLNNILPFSHIDEYPKKLKMVKVIADREKRKNTIRKQFDEFATQGIFILPDERLLDTVTDLVEYPTAVLATFDEKYLSLPPKIITSTLSQNQKYFSVVDSDGHLKNQFIFISNGDPAHSDIIRIGNEKVVRARLEDAQFFYTEDTKKPLIDYVLSLSEVVFHSQLGTLLQKTERISSLCKFLAHTIQVDQRQTDDMLRAATLAKADLITMMVSEKEFTKLQGYIGMNYALTSGETPDVATAIYEHYMPRGQNDSLPSNIIGATLAIADKIDTICGIIGIGLMPTGSADPYAIRRLANGVVQIIDSYDINVSLSDLIIQTYTGFGELITNVATQKDTVLQYLKFRIKWYLETENIDTDVLDALWAFEWDNIADIKSRARDLQYFKRLPSFETLVTGYKRVNNILEKNSSDTKVNISLLTQGAEIALYDSLKALQTAIRPLLREMDYKKVLETIVPFGAVIDQFFEDVLVMCEDQPVKQNRLALLAEIKDMFLGIADISRINYEKNENT